MYVCSSNTHLCWTNPKECHLINRGIKASATHDRFVLVSLNFQGNKRILQCNKNVNSRRQQCGQTDAKWSKYAPTYTHTDSFGLRTLEHLLKKHFTLSAKCSRLFVIDVFVVVVIVAGEQWTVTSTHTHTDTHWHTPTFSHLVGGEQWKPQMHSRSIATNWRRLSLISSQAAATTTTI